MIPRDSDLVAGTFLLAAALLLAGCSNSTATPITSPSGPAAVGMINESPLCRGIQLSTDRRLQDLAVFSWQRFGDGSRPVPTGLTGSMAVSSRIAPLSQLERIQGDPPNDNYVVIQFTGTGAALLRSVTQAAASTEHVGQPIPPEGYIGFFLGLTDSDIAAWPSVGQMLMQPIANGGKLLENAVVVQAVSSGELLVYVGSDLETGCSLTATNN